MTLRAWLDVLRRPAVRRERLAALERLEDPAALPEVAPLLFQADRALAEGAARAVGRLMPGDAEGLVRLDEAVRKRFRMIHPEASALSPLYDPYRRGRAAKASDLARLRGLPSGTAVLGLASFYHNGHFRQSAVRELAKIRSGDELPFLILRLNDWVEETARDARAAVEARLTDDYAPHWKRRRDLVHRARRWKRVDNKELLARLDALLDSAEK